MVSVLPPPGGGDFELAPEGSFIAICYQVVDLGTQSVTWEGDTKHQRKIMISWELPTERMEKDGRPFSVSKRYTWSTHPKGNLRPDLEAWRGKPFQDSDFNTWSIDAILGKACLLQVAHTYNKKNDRTYANVVAIMALPKGTTVPEHENPLIFFDLDHFDKSVWDRLSEGLKQVILKSPEGQKAVNGNGHRNGDLDDEIPF